MSLKSRISSFYRRNPTQWINGAEIEKFATEANFKGSNASRRLRELCKEGVLERRETAKGWVEYKYKQLPPAYPVELQEVNQPKQASLI